VPPRDRTPFASGPGSAACHNPLDALGEDHLAALQDAFRSLMETLEEVRALDQPPPAEPAPEAVVASGD